ncbi:MAG: ABC transporter permease subunit [Thermoprotei archaeon]|nr:ABC transporter permease subunit [Thermoprotei archaeon]
MRRALAMAVKEVKNLVRDRYVLFSIIIMPFLSMIIIGSMYSIGLRQAVEEARGVGTRLPEDAVLVLEDPGDALAKGVASLLNANTAASVEEALERYRIIIVFHRGFSESIEGGKRANVTLIVKASKPWSISDMVAASALASTLEHVVKLYVSQRFNVSLELLVSPLNVETKPYVEGRELSPAESGFLVFTIMATAFAILILSMVTLQVGAISVGMEREARTAELLLALPANRAEIVMGKAAGAVTVSFAAFISFVAGGIVFIYFLLPVIIIEQHVESARAAAALQILEFLNVQTVSIIALALALHIVNATLLGILVGILFAGDFRGALMASSYIGLALIAPLIPEVAGFTIPSTLEALFTLTPYYPPYKLVESLILGNYMKAPLYLAIILAYFIVLALASSKLMSGERLVYGIAFRRPKPQI